MNPKEYDFKISHYTLLYVPVRSRYGCNHAASSRMLANADVSYPTQVFSIGQEVNRAVAPQCAPGNFSTGAVTILPLPHLVYHCTLYLWNVNFTTCAQSLSTFPGNASWKCLCLSYMARPCSAPREIWTCCLQCAACTNHSAKFSHWSTW